MRCFTLLCAAVPFAIGLATAQADAQTEKPVLSVYTYNSFSGEYGPGATIKGRFEQTCGCTLEWVETDDAGTLLARLKLEGGSTRADVVLGLDTNLLAEAKETKLFTPHGLNTSALALPIAWTDDIFVPFDWGWFAFVYDETRLAKPPASLAELVDAPDSPKIIIQDPRTSTPGLGLLLWMREVYGEDAAEAWRKLSPKIVTVTQGWSEAYGLFLKGEADMVLSYTTSPAYHIGAEQDPRFKAAIFPEGHYLQVEVAAMTAASDQPDLARSFLRFAMSEEFQSAIPEGNWMYPATEIPGGLPPSFAGLDKPAKSLLTDSEEVRTNRRQWVDDWLAALAR